MKPTPRIPIRVHNGCMPAQTRSCPSSDRSLETAIARSRDTLGLWKGGDLWTTKQPADLAAALSRLAEPLFLIDVDGRLAVAVGGTVRLGHGPEDTPRTAGTHRVLAIVPPCRPADLGDPQFCRDLGLRLPYVAGAMANGIASADLVCAMGRNGMLGIFGAAGLAPALVATNIDRIASRLGQLPWGANLIHSPYEPAMEDAIVDLYLQRRVELVCASAYLDVTLPVVRYRLHGIHADPEGRVVVPNHLLAKVSRVEVARKFFAPPPDPMLAELVRRGDLSATQARLAQQVPVAQDLTAEADSGGHTDNRPALVLLPTMLALRDRMQREHGYSHRLRVGAAGGISTPHSAAAAFAMGAAYVLTGSINQATREAGTSDAVRQMLAEVEQADVRMAPAADMFEMGVKLQVTSRQTMFPMRAQKLYDLYTAYPSLEAIPDDERIALEKRVLRRPVAAVWADTEAFWQERDPAMLTRAATDPHHKMALVFRWYLAMSSRWANTGVAERKLDYQIWCGPAMGAFNEWVRGSYLEPYENRRVVPIALNILNGAAVLARVAALRNQGVDVPADCVDLAPREFAELTEIQK